ncbi:hypothetical protein [Bradyrhizobium symbiodeficiens]|uniref:Uncharacterized protein n=1 Tax=Bradyrhizobium symbiodeficiens TaxID=1404367 RepID=A0A6G9AAN7_9BRAD|nr:hypothetical protein [Bradyrhizobium symbiodeficiens]QIP09537.1 hypothetical protein HAV00_26270 [Bradyrhizobium symbiodeficiens]
MGWSEPFDEPIVLPNGRHLVTLLNAGNYVATLPAATQRRPEWQAAAEALLLVAERGGPTMLARIRMARALNASEPPPALRARSANSFRIIRWPKRKKSPTGTVRAR